MYPSVLAGPLAALRTYTDPISNAVLITSANPLVILEDLARGRVAPRFLSTILHETTHYSSYITPVGYSLAALLTAHTADRFGMIMDQDKVKGAAAVAIRAQIASTYFAPLLEGLALFAEFDVLPGPSPVASTVSSVGLRIFCLEGYISEIRKGHARCPSDYLGQFLAENRVSPDFLQRKRELLKAPVSDKDGYLLGYLWIKALWNVLQDRCPKLSDTDFFLSFLISYFFEDYRLANLLFNFTDALEAQFDIDDYAALLIGYFFVDRFNELCANVQVYVDQYEAYATQFQPGSLHNLKTAGSGMFHPDYQGYSEQAALAVNQAVAFASIRSIHHMWPKFLDGRHILRLFAHPATVSIDEAGRYTALCDDGNRIEGQALDAGRPMSGEAVTASGSVEAIFLTDRPEIVICLFLDRDLIATIDPLNGEQNRLDAAEACDELSSFAALEAAAVRISEEKRFRKGSRAEKMASDALKRAQARTLECYSNLGLASDAGAPLSEPLLSQVQVGGIAQVLADTPSDAEWLARLSLSSSGRPTTVVEASKHWGVSPDDIMQQLSRLNRVLSERLGKEAFVTDGQSFGRCQF